MRWRISKCTNVLKDVHTFLIPTYGLVICQGIEITYRTYSRRHRWMDRTLNKNYYGVFLGDGEPQETLHAHNQPQPLRGDPLGEEGTLRPALGHPLRKGGAGIWPTIEKIHTLMSQVTRILVLKKSHFQLLLPYATDRRSIEECMRVGSWIQPRKILLHFSCVV